MKISAILKSDFNHHDMVVQTGETEKELQISSQSTGVASSVSGHELLLLSMANSFCNDLYGEATKRNITISGVHVIVSGEFGPEGEPATRFTYKADVVSDAAPSEIEELINFTDRSAAVYHILRKGVTITLTP